MAVRSGWRMSTGGRLAGAAVLEEEPEVRDDGAEERQQDAELKRHAEGCQRAGRVTMAAPTVTLVIGTTGSPLDPTRRGRQASEARPQLRRECSGRRIRRKADKPLLFVDIDGVLSLFGLRTGQASSGDVDQRRRHRRICISATRLRAPSRPRRTVRPRLVQRMGGEGRRAPPPCASPARSAPLSHLPRATTARRALEARRDRAPCGRPPAGLDRRRPDDACRAWAASATRRRCWSRPTPPRGLTAAHVRALEGWADAL